MTPRKERAYNSQVVIYDITVEIFIHSLVMDYPVRNRSGSRSFSPLSQVNQSRKGIVDGSIARHSQSSAIMAGDRSVTSDEARKLNL